MIAAIVQGPIGRLIPVGILLLAVQTAVFTEVRPLGVVPQVLVAFAAAAGVAGGPERGMLAGFVVGLMFDLSTGAPMGSSAITMGVAGMVAGMISFLNVEPRWWLAALFVMLGSAAGEAAVPLLRFLIGQERVLSDDVFLVVPVVAVAAGVFSPLLVPLGRWSLRLGKVEWKVPADER